MTARIAIRKLPDTYFQLVKQFPPTHIRDRAHLDLAQEVIERLLESELEDDSQEYLDALTDLIEVCENEHEPIPDASEADVLRELIRSSGLSQMSLAKKVGIAQSTISAVLNGSRRLTREQLVSLARFFDISPEAFLPG
jgi:HTH-type transcriptional regulator / antitoxin HigA